MTMDIRPVAITAAVLLLLAWAPVRAQDAMPVDLTGVWNLDAAASDDLQAMMKDAISSLRQQRSGGKGGRRGGMGGRGGGMGGRGGERPTTGQGPGGGMIAALDQLLITVDGADFEIMDGTDQTRIWTPDGEPVVRDGQVTERAWWDGETLVLETVRSRTTMTRRLSRSDDGKRLVSEVRISLQGLEKPVVATLVYAGI